MMLMMKKKKKQQQQQKAAVGEEEGEEAAVGEEEVEEWLELVVSDQQQQQRIPKQHEWMPLYYLQLLYICISVSLTLQHEAQLAEFEAVVAEPKLHPCIRIRDLLVSRLLHTPSCWQHQPFVPPGPP